MTLLGVVFRPPMVVDDFGVVRGKGDNILLLFFVSGLFLRCCSGSGGVRADDDDVF